MLHSLFCQATHTCTWNGQAYDNKIAVARFLAHGLKAPPPAVNLDGLKLLRRVGKFASGHSLDNVSKILLGEGKLEHEGKELWFKCLSEKYNAAAWRTMTAYCARDTYCTTKIWKIIAPFNPNPPPIFQRPLCPNCGSHNTVRRGYRTTRCRTKIRRQCRDCSTWFME